MEVVGEEKETKHTTCLCVVASCILAQVGLPFFFQILSLGIFTVSLWYPVCKHCLNSTSFQGMYSPPSLPCEHSCSLCPHPQYLHLLCSYSQNLTEFSRYFTGYIGRYLKVFFLSPSLPALRM